MGIMDKLMFWKHEPDFGSDIKGMEDIGGRDLGLGKDPSLDLGHDTTTGLGGTGELPPMGMEKDVNIRGPGFEHVEQPKPLESAPLEKKPIYFQEMGQQGGAVQQQYAAPQRDLSKDLEVISAKLDTIKSMLDTLNHRLNTLERQQNKKGSMEW